MRVQIYVSEQLVAGLQRAGRLTPCPAPFRAGGDAGQDGSRAKPASAPGLQQWTAPHPAVFTETQNGGKKGKLFQDAPGQRAAGSRAAGSAQP